MTIPRSAGPTTPAGRRRGVKAVLLVPSWGLGGGVERYVEGLLGIVEEEADCTIAALLRPGDRPTRVRKIGFVVRVCRSAWTRRRFGRDLVVIVAHVGLLPAALAVRLVAPRARLFLIGHGAEIWAGSPLLRLTRRIGLKLIAVSEFTAGSLVRYGPVGILSAVLDAKWVEQLVATGVESRQPHAGPLDVLTVFRLAAAEQKGLVELVEAIGVARAVGPIELTVAGSGELPEWALETLRRVAAKVVANPTDSELARLYADADVVALCTRVRTRGRPVSGEGFGLTLLEAQLAGTAVIAPSSGGSNGAYVNGVSGLQPADEGVESLAQVLTWYVRHPAAAANMGQEGRRWAVAVTDRDRLLDQVRATFFVPNEPTAQERER